MAEETAKEGQDRLMETAQQIVKNLGRSKNMADDMIMILSTFDNRLSNITTGMFSSNRLTAAEEVILRWDSPAAGFLPFDDEDCRHEAIEYLVAVDDILALTEDGSGVEDDVRDKAEILLQIAMSRLEDELRHAIVQNSVPLDSDSVYGYLRKFSSLSFATDCAAEESESPICVEERGSLDSSMSRSHDGSSSLSEDLNPELMRPEAAEYIKEIVDRMIRSRYDKECCRVYSSSRRDFLDECLSVLGVERISIEEVQKVEWKSLDDKMKTWSQSVKVVIKVILLAEKQLFDSVFGDKELIKEACFTETVKVCIKQLLAFAEAVTIRRRTPEKLFRILDMYDALADVMPDLQVLFTEDFRNVICCEADGILTELGDAAIGTFFEFESAVKRDTSRKPIPGGDIHPLTRYVMNYVKLAVDYSSLNTLLEESGYDNDDDDTGEECKDRNSGSICPLGCRLRVLISYLISNLEEKSQLYEDGALKYIFLMNNILYIVKKVKDSELRAFLGDQWVRKRRGLVRRYSTGYLRASWTKVLACLRDEGIGGSGGSASSASKVALKERFKNFNLAYDEIYRIQSTWKVPDPQLREELRISISEMVIPAYRSFMGRFGSHLEYKRHASKYIKYTADDLEDHLVDLFEGSCGSSSHPRRRLSS